MDIILSAKQKFSVHIDDFSSNIKTINFYVPQGSILGPILFNCYARTMMEIIPETEENFVSGCDDDNALMNSFHHENAEIFSTLVSNIACIQD